MMLTPAALADTRHHLHPYTQLRQLEKDGPLVIVKGDGVHVEDEQGRRYLEGMAGLWCASLGFSERRLADAAERQMRTLPYYHSFSGKVPGPVTELVQALDRWSPIPGARVLFANSGSESNDTAVKLVRYYNNARGRPLKKKIIGRVKGYHGVTVAAASLSGIPTMHQHFDLPMDGVVRVGVEACDDGNAATKRPSAPAQPIPDITDHLSAIDASASSDDLAKVYAAAYEACQGNQQLQAKVIAAKKARIERAKKEKANGK